MENVLEYWWILYKVKIHANLLQNRKKASIKISNIDIIENGILFLRDRIRHQKDTAKLEAVNIIDTQFDILER